MHYLILKIYSELGKFRIAEKYYNKIIKEDSVIFMPFMS